MSEWWEIWANGLSNEGRSAKSGHRMAAEGMQFPWRGNDGTISRNFGVIWEMSVKAFRRRRSDAVDVGVAGKDTVNKAPRAFGARQGGEVQ